MLCIPLHAPIYLCIAGVTTLGKKCRICGMVLRYQEWEEGLHNFNDKVILTLHFCVYLRNCLQVDFNM